jgi:hypothetical protein
MSTLSSVFVMCASGRLRSGIIPSLMQGEQYNTATPFLHIREKANAFEGYEVQFQNQNSRGKVGGKQAETEEEDQIHHRRSIFYPKIVRLLLTFVKNIS